ncbi:hypothetical protein BDM02DRAFT_3124685 [Thelephora ganbajun]|uniref:Uncharacterized protein n=1 Tax=Thelephora ganbajun TaxID=370292 RepID=A0ACB6YXX6_THEGA|nr:hypothetical protein BDM02DRAFT_3124685 [Thelephora ganbajun]
MNEPCSCDIPQVSSPSIVAIVSGILKAAGVIGCLQEALGSSVMHRTRHIPMPFRLQGISYRKKVDSACSTLHLNWLELNSSHPQSSWIDLIATHRRQLPNLLLAVIAETVRKSLFAPTNKCKQLLSYSVALANTAHLRSRSRQQSGRDLSRY